MVNCIKESTNKYISTHLNSNIKSIKDIKNINDIKNIDIDAPNTLYLLSFVSMISFFMGYKFRSIV
jgi:hypothetical protein